MRTVCSAFHWIEMRQLGSISVVELPKCLPGAMQRGRRISNL